MAKKLEVVITGDTKHLGRAFQKGAQDASGFKESLGTIKDGATKAAVGLGIVVAAATGVGLALYKIGADFDNAFDTIRVGTGATGAALDGLTEDFKAVAADTPAQLSDVGIAIADLNTRLGLTGPPLQDLSRQFLELSRITGTELASNIRLGTRVFGDWSIAAQDQAAALDWLFKVSQATGVGFDDLSQNVVAFGTSLRGMGFSFEDATAMLGKFEKEGVNTETVLASLKIGLKKMADAGINDAGAAFQQLQEDIKGAETDTKAISKAAEYFGSRAAADMALAIRENRLNLGNFTQSLRENKETIRGAADDTADWAEQWQLIKNNVFLALEPIASSFFGAIGAKAAEHMPAIQSFGREVAGIWDKKDISITAKVSYTKEALEGLLADLGLGAERAHEITDAMQRVGWAGFGVSYSLMAIADGLKMVAYVGGAAFSGLALQAMYVANTFMAMVDTMFGAAQALAELPGVPDSWRDKVNKAADTVNQMHSSTATTLDLQKEDWKRLWATSGDAAKGMAENSTKAAQAFRDAFGPNNTIPAPLAKIKDQNKADLDRMMQDMMAGGQGMTANLGAGIAQNTPIASGAAGGAAGAASAPFAPLPGLAGLTGTDMMGQLGANIGAHPGPAQSAAQQAMNAANAVDSPTAKQKANSGGSSLIDSFWQGMDSAKGWLEEKIGGLLGWIGGFFGGSLPEWGPLAGGDRFFKGGVALLHKFGEGLHMGSGLIKGILDKVTSQAGAHFGGGVGQWASTVLQALQMTGHPASWLQGVLLRMQQESGGNPGAINLWDSNAAAGDPSRGLMQTIMSTFLGYHQPGTSMNIFDPLANIAAAINYIAARYGSPYDLPLGGYAAGGWAGLRGPELAWLGERGPEYVVPNNRLGALGGVTIAQGAIVIHGATDPAATADAVYRKIMQKLERNVRLL